MYRRHTMETVHYQYQHRTTATSNLRLTQIKIRGKQTAVLQTFFGCGNDGPVKVIWLHERSEGLKFFEVLRSLSVQVWRLSGRQMLRCPRGKNISWGWSPSTRHGTHFIFMHVALMTTVSKSHRGTMHDFFFYICFAAKSQFSNGFVYLWTKTWSKSLKSDVNQRKYEKKTPLETERSDFKMWNVLQKKKKKKILIIKNNHQVTA